MTLFSNLFTKILVICRLLAAYYQYLQNEIRGILKDINRVTRVRIPWVAAKYPIHYFRELLSKVRRWKRCGAVIEIRPRAFSYSGLKNVQAAFWQDIVHHLADICQASAAFGISIFAIAPAGLFSARVKSQKGVKSALSSL
jgi:hypothetical protein